MELGTEDVSLLERCPHFRDCYVQTSMELGTEDVSLLEECPHFRVTQLENVPLYTHTCTGTSAQAIISTMYVRLYRRGAPYKGVYTHAVSEEAQTRPVQLCLHCGCAPIGCTFKMHSLKTKGPGAYGIRRKSGKDPSEGSRVFCRAWLPWSQH